MKFTRVIGRLFHHSDGRVERSISVFDGTKLVGAVGTIKKEEKKAETIKVVQPIIEKVGDKVPDSYLEPLERIGVVKTH